MTTQTDVLPGSTLKTEKMPGHWLLARLGKRVLRPGGLELTRKMIEGLAITRQDHVVEFAPGLGMTARYVLAAQPASYTGVEADEHAAKRVQRELTSKDHRCVVGRAEDTGLPDACASVIYGEAMLTMQTAAHKHRIIQEAHRLLTPGGRYGIHELCLAPNDLDEDIKQAISRDLSEAIHVGARPLTVSEWKSVLENEGFTVAAEATAPMHLLEPRRLIQDEGLPRTLKILWNALRDPVARARMLAMRRTFRRHEQHIAAVVLVAEKSPLVPE